MIACSIIAARMHMKLLCLGARNGWGQVPYLHTWQHRKPWGRCWTHRGKVLAALRGARERALGAHAAAARGRPRALVARVVGGQVAQGAQQPRVLRRRLAAQKNPENQLDSLPSSLHDLNHMHFEILLT